VHYEAQRKLRELQARTAHVLVAEDFDDLAELNTLAVAITDPQKGIDSPMLTHAVFFGGLPVYPLTLAHLTFLDECREMLADDEAALSASMLWAVTVPRIDDGMYDGRATRKTIRRWARHCPWTQADIDAIMDLRYGRLSRQADKTGAADAVNNDGALIGMLCREYGENPHYWMHEAAIGVIEACVTDWLRTQEAQAKAYRRSAGGKGAAVAPMPSPKFVAMRKFRECSERIEAKWRSAV
jgi:hypothetical protein